MNADSYFANSVHEMMSSHLAVASTEMFADFGLPIERVSAAPPVTSARSSETAVVAIIGYVGTGVRGALIMVALQSTVATWVARMGSEGADTADALGEFSNMLLGRLKARLLPEGMTIQLATPTIASGSGIRISVPPSRSASLTFEESAGTLRLRLDANFDLDFALAETSNGDAPPAKAGETILF